MKVKTEIKVIKGAPLDGLNPLPKFRKRTPTKYNCAKDFPEELKVSLGTHTKVLPYLLQDRFSRKRIPLKLKCMVLENDYLRAEFLPEYGGRLYSLYDKVNKCDLVLRNPVIQPGNIAIRNAWLSGGIEWNLGNLGHCATTCDNVFCAKLDDGEGNEFIRIYEFERLKSIFWQVDFHLPTDSEHLIVHVRIVNPFDKDTTTYWWSNVAVEDLGQTRILASGKNIISFLQGDIYYEKLPKIQVMPGVDVSYPSQATRSFDFFIQPNTKEECTWEAAAYPGGVVFYERSTPPLSYKKLFCWGNHHAGKHWQEFLSDKGSGYYAEIQAGIAPSQVHDMIFPKNTSYEWTQCFGGVKLDEKKLYDDDYYSACNYFDDALNKRMSESKILALDEKLKKCADIPVCADDLVHTGSGFGALEIMRMEIDKDATAPKTMCFPLSTIGNAEYPWYNLLKTGVLPAECPRVFPSSYMISDKWLPHIENSLKADGGKSWYSLMHYGIAIYEGADLTDYAKNTCDEADIKMRNDAAEAAWLESIKEMPSYWVYRNLAILEEQRNNLDKAEEYYDKAIAITGAFDDFALAAEYLGFLVQRKKYDKVWSIYATLPANCKKDDRVDLYTAKAAVRIKKFDFIEAFFNRPHHDIREGENTLTDIWFEFCANKIAIERGITELDSETLANLIDEAIDTCPPSEDIDFRMSTDKKIKYRID